MISASTIFFGNNPLYPEQPLNRTLSPAPPALPGDRAGPAPSWGAAFLSFWVACAILALQVSLTRIFSVVLWYHFGFMIVSLAMLGFALAGAAVRRLAKREGAIFLPAGRAAFIGAGLTLPLVAVVTRIPLDPTLVVETFSQALLFGLVILIAALLFFILGFAQCAVLEAGRRRINRVYGFSFLGGAAGIGLSLGGMEYLGGGGGVMLAAAAAWIGAFAVPELRRACRGAAWLSLIVLIASLAAFPGIVPESSRKHFPHVPPEQVIDREWNAFSSVLFYRNPERHGLWALSPGFRGKLPEMLGIAIDEWAITSIVKWDGRIESGEDGDPDLAFFDAYPPTLGLATAEDGFDALVIGAGGGLDVLAALYYGAGHVTAVEINPLIVNAVKGRFDDYSGGIYKNEKVRAVAAEGRYFVERDERLYSRIVLTGVDTFAATAAGSFALSENYIYTVEAFQGYIRRIEPDGMICMTRWFFEPPRQTLRLVNAAREALAQEGVENPDDCFFLAKTRGRARSLLLMKKEPFSDSEIRELCGKLGERNVEIVHARGVRGHPLVDFFFTVRGRAAFESGFPDGSRYPYRVDAPTDDCPFLFEHGRWTNLFQRENEMFLGPFGGHEVLAVTFLALLLFLVLGLVLIRGKRRKEESRAGGVDPPPPGNRFLTAAAFTLIGVAYLAAESALLPRLVLSLGHPVYAMSIVLVGLLVWSGLGSMASRLVPATGGWAAAACIAAGAAGPVVFIFLFESMDAAILHASLGTKIGLSVILLALPGFLMGIPFPLAVRFLSGKDADLVPRAFLWNGAGSALACPAAMAMAITFGFNVSFIAAAGCYVIASAALWIAAGNGRESPQE